MVDVTDIPGAAEEDRATLAGRDRDEMLSMERLADLCGGFRYEIPCVLGKQMCIRDSITGLPEQKRREKWKGNGY